jgi:AraC-like DNA-binding protein
MILFIAICTLFLTIVQACYNYKINTSGLYLTGFLVPLCLGVLLHYFSIVDDSPFLLAIVYGHFMPVLYLTGPMLYFYVRSTLNDSSRLSKWDGIHFLPSIVGLISIFPYYFESFDSKLKIANNLINDPNYHLGLNISWLYDNSYNLLFRMVLLTFYVLISFIILIRFHWKKKSELTFNQKGIVLKWLYAVLLLVGICTFSYLALTVDFFNGKLDSRSNINTLNINYFFGVSFSLIPVLLIVFPQVLYGIPAVSSIQKNRPEIQKASKNATKKVEEDEEEVLNKLAEMVLNYMRNEKPFTDPNFSLEDLSRSMDIQKHHLYYCFNTVLNSRFTSIRAQMRVEYAKECLLTGNLEQLSMEGIWTKAGFSSRTSFFGSFKEFTGVTPTEFIKINQLEAIDKEVN